MYACLRRTQVWLRRSSLPRPGIPEPQGWEYTQPGWLGAAVVDRDLDQDVFRLAFCILHENVEVAIIVKNTGIEQLILKLRLRTALIRFHQVPVRVLPLRVLLEIFHVRMRGGGVYIEVVFLDVLTVVPLAVGEPE